MNDIKQNNFHIYAVKTIDEGIEILTGLEAGKRDEKGLFPPDSFNFKVEENLTNISKRVKRRL